MTAAPAEYTRWQEDRMRALTAEDGWLNLIDRVVLRAGGQSVGSAADNDVVLSRGPAHLGRLTLDAAPTFQAPGGPTQSFAPTPSYPQLRVPPFLLELHSVDGETALRVRDLTLPRQTVLHYFAYDPSWNIRARWEALTVPQSLSVAQKGAVPEIVTLSHRAHFSREGQDFTLLATHWKGDLPMFVIRDRTSGHETYAASRFLIGENMAGDSITLDFNKAHNPPCSFTDFAICPLPPRENILPVEIRAGEHAPG